MKKSKWLIISLIVLLLVAAGIYVYLSGKTSADAFFNKSNDLTCISKEVADKVMFNPGSGTLLLGTKNKALNTTETGSPFGIFIKKADQIYFTNGLQYTSKPDVSSNDYTTFKIGDIYYAAKHKAITNIADLKLNSSEALYVYNNSLYVVDLAAKIPSNQGIGYLYNKNGVTRMCTSQYSYEFDAAKTAYPILSDGTVKYTYNIAVLNANGTELIPYASTASKKTYGVNLNQTVNLRESWTPSNPGGSGRLEYVSGKENIEQLSTTSYRMIKYGFTTLRITYSLPDGTTISDEVTFEAAKG